ncbi:VPS4-associated protein 1 [Ustulina deusta]|nr:VPS4-associated protein 1 [Ustulina deusta]
MSLPNIWHHRKVADTSAKGCEICFKPSTSVLITPDKQDFFYVCLAHLQDRGFCSPIIDHDAVAAKRKKEMDEEVERLKREYEEKQRKKKEKEAEKGKDQDKEKDKKDDQEKGDDKGEKKEDSTSDDKGKSKQKSPAEAEEEPRVFALQRAFYQRRIDRKRQAEMAKRNRERLNNPNFFPSVPKGLP